MALRQRTTDHEPPSTPPHSSRGSALTSNAISCPTLYDRLGSSKEVVLALIQNITWPLKSAEAAQELRKTINIVPDLRNLPEDAAKLPSDLIVAVERLVQSLEEVRNKLRSASLNYGREKTGLLGAWGAWDLMMCSHTLRSCQEGVEKALGPVFVRLRRFDSQRRTALEGDSELGHQGQSDNSIPQRETTAASPQITTSHGRIPHINSTENSAAGPGPQGGETLVNSGVLTAARKTFKTVEVLSGTIPIVGNYVGAAAKVGLAVVRMAEKMDENEELAKELGERVMTLSKFVGYFEARSEEQRGDELATQINKLKREIGRLRTHVEEWESSGRLMRAFSATEHGEALNAYKKAIDNAFEGMQVLASLNITALVEQLRNDGLLNRLGNGDYGAGSNSIENATCLSGTRVEILKRIDEWIVDFSGPKHVLLIKGMAGRGKSTIARTVAQKWRGRAASAIFHVRRDRNASNKLFVCVLARQLARCPVPEVSSAILESVQENGDVVHQSLQEQFEELLINSLKNLKSQIHPILIIVDALDEFQNAQDAVEFLNLISQHSSPLPPNVKFLLTSRPDAALFNALEEEWQTEDLDSIADVDADLTLFVQDCFSVIKEKSGKKCRLKNDWPSPREVGRVVEMSQGLFQWVRTAMTYVGEGSPVLRLRELLQSPSIWGRLDYLYSQIFSKAFDPGKVNPMRRELLSWILGTLVVTRHPLTLEIIAYLYADSDTFTEMEHDQVIYSLRTDILGDLHSVLLVPESPAEPLRLLHMSIRDFLAHQGRCQREDYGVDVVRHHQRLRDVCLRLMERDLRKNICNLSSISKANSEVLNIIDLKVPHGLRHCCRSWSIHLMSGVHWKETSAEGLAAVVSDLKAFSEKNLLNWLEILSLIGETAEAGAMANDVHQWLLKFQPKVQDSSLTELWNDAHRFIAAFQEPISFGAPHIYASALANCPVETKIWEHYGHLATVHLPDSQQPQAWPSMVWRRLVGSEVHTVVFSSNGKTLASGSEDGMIRLWNAQTGLPQGQPLAGHLHSVSAVAFSPDSKILASGSRDQTIRFWDVQTGLQLDRTLFDHDDSILSITFSPDGKRLASGSRDETIRLWDVQTGSRIGLPLTGHHDAVSCVAFSPNGNKLASGSWDDTIRLWDPQVGLPLGEPLVGHRNSISSVAFSPCGKSLASGSEDCTIRLWDAQTGLPLGQPLTGHADSVLAVAFSPDNTAIASGSRDYTIRLWDAQTGLPLGQALASHNNVVRSVAFSPDGKTLASGSWDHAIRLWDAQPGLLPGQPLMAHAEAISSIAFSPNGTLFASGSEDGTIRLWHALTGLPFGQPLAGHGDSISSITFSPDSDILASGSRDQTIRLWDPQTGLLLGLPLTGHHDSILCVAFAPTGKTLASGSGDRMIRLWDVTTGSLLGQPLSCHEDTVLSVAFSLDGKTLASGSQSGTIRLWDLRDGSLISQSLIGQGNSIRSIAFSSDNRIMFDNDSSGDISKEGVLTLQQTNIHYGLSFENPLRCVHQDQWLSIGGDRILWLPEQYWRNIYYVATFFKGGLVYSSGKSLFFFRFSSDLRLQID